MRSILDINSIRVAAMVREFAAEMGFSETPTVERIYVSADYPKDRQVFKLSAGAQAFALKLDHQSHRTKRLEHEFAVLSRIDTHFANYEKVSTLKPLYLSQDGKFFVTPYQDRKTANQVIRKSGDIKTVRQVFRRAGQWLGALHDYKAPAKTGIWPNWMIEEIEAAVRKPAAKVASADYLPLLKKLISQANQFEGTDDTQAFCHGDFHGSNLILGKGETIGFDFTEAQDKLAVYDIVDFLKGDVFRPAHQEDIDSSGIARPNKEMFFKLYRHPIDMDLLDFCIRGRLLIEWVSITQQAYDKRPFERRKYDLLQERLHIAFK